MTDDFDRVVCMGFAARVAGAALTYEWDLGDRTRRLGNPWEPITFQATASDPGPIDQLTFTWDFGDGETAKGAEVTHVLAQTGCHDVTLTVSDALPDRCGRRLGRPDPPLHRPRGSVTRSRLGRAPTAAGESDPLQRSLNLEVT